MTHVKICGLSEPQSLHAAAEAGARFAGFVFFPPSPRAVSLDSARHLIKTLPSSMHAVGLFVNPDDIFLENTIRETALDMIQLHGSESPDRVLQIRQKFGLPVIKAIGIATAADLQISKNYENCVDWLLFDTKPPSPDLPGGTGKTFEWSILKGQAFSKPWMLSGGLNIDNISDALHMLAPDAVDISSGVETIRGVKDPDKIKAFIQAVKQA